MAIKAFEVHGDIVLKDNGAAKKLDAFGKKAQQVGKNLTKFVTLPLLGIGAAMLKVANDQLQAEAALQNAIKATGRETEISVDRLKQYTAALQETTTYGDEAQLSALALVQQLGNLNEEGLKKILPNMLNFSSAMGVDLQTAASLIGKTLGSATNALSRYGIEIDATAGPTEKLAQLTAAMDEKFAGAAETAAKTGLGPLLQLKNSVGDLAEEFGTLLLPTLNKVIDGIKTGIKWFSELDEGQKQMIITLAGIAAAAGPVIGAIGGISRAIGFLAANPIVLAIGAIAGLSIGIAALINKKDKERVAEYAEEINDMAIAAGVAEENIAALAKELNDLATISDFVLATNMALVAEEVGRVAKQYGITRQEAVKLIKTNDDISDSMRAVLDIYGKQFAELDAINKLSQGTRNDMAAMAADAEYLAGAEERIRVAADAKAKAEEEAADALAEQLRLIREQIRVRKIDAYKEFVEQQRILNTEIKVGLIAENDRATILQREIANRKAYISTVIAEGEITKEQFNGHIEALQALEDEYALLTAAEKEYSAGVSETYQNLKTWGQEHLTDETEIANLIAQIKLEKQREVFEQAEEMRQKELEDLENLKAAYVGYAQAISGTIQPLFEQLGTAIVENGDAWKALGRAAVGAIAGIVRGLGEQAVIQSAISFATGDIGGGFLYAGAATAAFIAAGVIDGLAGSFEQGGVIPGNSYSGDKLLARVNSGERVLTAQQNAQYESMMQSPAVSYQTTNNYTSRSEDINVSVGEQALFTIVQRGLDSQKIIPGRRPI